MGHTVARAQLLGGPRVFFALPIPSPSLAREYVSGTMTGLPMPDTGPDSMPDHVPHPERSVYEHASPTRATPVILLTVPPAMFANDRVSAAMENSITAVCGETNADNSLAEMVHSLRDADYTCLRAYRPDTDTPLLSHYEAWPKRHHIFRRNNMQIPELAGPMWGLTLRHMTGVFTLAGNTWLGIYIYGLITSADASDEQLRPHGDTERDYVLEHRGQCAPFSLAFDMFIPVEPQIVTAQWGWGADLETLQAERDALYKRKAEKECIAPPHYSDQRLSSWNTKAKRHKTARALQKDRILIQAESRLISEQLVNALSQRERARKVLHKYAWQALLLGILESRQLHVRKKQHA